MDVSTNCDCDCEVLRNRVIELQAQVENLMDILQCTINITSPYSINHQESGVSISESESVCYSKMDVQTDISISQSTIEIQTVETEVDCSSEISASTSLPSMNCPVSNQTENPYELFIGHPFSQCSMSELDRHTEPHYQYFSNRCVAYSPPAK